ncbi:MAG: hypothetical protein HFG32_13815 [Eubacterium sp.]|nr:hypothetical protein [Clostridia bacterium]MCI9421047.1 hypothetical protein [Eubacterium sp.]
MMKRRKENISILAVILLIVTFILHSEWQLEVRIQSLEEQVERLEQDFEQVKNIYPEAQKVSKGLDSLNQTLNEFDEQVKKSSKIVEERIAIEKKALEAYKILIENMNSVQACSILGLIEFNSQFDSELTESEGLSYGLMQWSYVRKENLESFASERGKDSNDFEIQVQFILEELNPESHYYQLISREGFLPSDWETVETVTNGVECLSNMYERSAPSKEWLEKKIAAAEYYYTLYCK